MEYFNNISYFISHIYLMLYIYLFVNHRYSKRTTAAICFTAGLLLALTDCLKLNIFPESDLCYFTVTIIQIIITQSTVIFISENRDSKVLFLGLSASNYVISGSILAAVLHIYTGNDILALTGSFFTHLLILLFLYFKIRDMYLKLYGKEYMKNWWELCLIPAFFYCGFSFLAFFPHTLYENPDNIPGTVIFIITMFVSYVAVLRYVESESNRADIYWKNVLFESYIKGLENYSHLVEQSEKNLRILRHDMRHYSGMIDSLLTQGKYEEIHKLTAYINKVTDENKVPKYSNNMILNSIICDAMDWASTLGISINLDNNIPKELPVNDCELAAVIANLFENAFICIKDFPKEKRYINAKIHCAQDHLLIQMENEYKNEIFFDSLTGLPKSKKGKNHGLGMQSISAFSDKINGNIGCYCENGMFHIMLFAKF